MKRLLVWHVDRPRADLMSEGPLYYADADYSPGAVRLHARQAPNAGDLKVDIRDDGTSIFTSNYAALNKGATLEENAEDYPNAEPEVAEGSQVSFHIVDAGGAEGVTCELELYSVADEDETEEV